jgi:hypothetical protein
MSQLPEVRLGPLTVTRFIVGGNPFSGHAHQAGGVGKEMVDYHTVERIKATLRECEQHGVNTFLGRGDNHIQRMLNEYWNEGGTLQWIAQTAPERASVEANVSQIKGAGAVACFLHGGMADRLFREGDPEVMRDWIAHIKELGMVAGMASHNHEFPLRAEEMDLGCEFYMCCFYLSESYKRGELYLDEDRENMCATIRAIDKPCLAYKIMAAGRNDPEEAFSYAFANIKPTDAVVVGVYTKHHPDQVAENVALTVEYGQ